MRILLIAAVTSVLSFNIKASDVEQPAFVSLFSNTCMKYFYVQENLRVGLSEATVLQGETAAFFLGGKPGTAWSVSGDSDGGKYVVTLSDEKVCSVFAQRAPVAEVQASFAALVDTAPEPLTSHRRDAVGPNDAPLTSLAYAWSGPEDTRELLFLLTTSSEAEPTVQAMATMALVDKPRPDADTEAAPAAAGK